ncbi:hypothetical protein AHAS_Ahas20G0023700 [Arachis hypogaea]
MLVSSPFRKSWKNEEKLVHPNSCYIKFCPFPEDRVYKKFGLFIMTCLPAEAEKLELDIHLADGRYVISTFVPFGVVEFDKDEPTGKKKDHESPKAKEAKVPAINKTMDRSASKALDDDTAMFINMAQ